MDEESVQMVGGSTDWGQKNIWYSFLSTVKDLLKGILIQMMFASVLHQQQARTC